MIEKGGFMKIRTLIILLVALAMISITCSKKEPTEVISSEFKITNFVYCSEEPSDYMEYHEQSDATYKPGDVVWIYMNLTNAKYDKNPDSSYLFSIPEHLTVKGPEGDVQLDQDFLIEPINLSKEKNPNQLYLTNNINTLTNSPEGEYQVEITVTDKLSEKTSNVTSKFWLKK